MEDLNTLKPIYTQRNIMSAFLGQDPDITVTANPAKNELNIIVGGCEAKAEAMRIFLKGTIEVCGKEYTLLVNGKTKSYNTVVTPGIVETAFTGNKVYDSLYIKTLEDGSIDKWAMLFKNVTVQFPNDNGGSPFGFETHSAEDLARLALTGKHEGVMLYSTVSPIGDNGYWDHKFPQ